MSWTSQEYRRQFFTEARAGAKYSEPPERYNYWPTYHSAPDFDLIFNMQFTLHGAEFVTEADVHLRKSANRDK